MQGDDEVTKREVNVVPYLVRADLDKPHRCPACYRSGASEITDWRVKVWRTYECPWCGQRFARRPLLPVHPDGWAYSWRVRYGAHFRHCVRYPVENAWWYVRTRARHARKLFHYPKYDKDGHCERCD